VAFHPDGKLLASGHWNNVSQLWDVASGQRLTVRRGFAACRFSADGKKVGWTEGSGTYGRSRVVGPSHFTVLEIPMGTPATSKTTFSADERWLASIHTDGLRLWEVAGARLAAFRAASVRAADAVFAPDGQSILTTFENQFWRWPLMMTDSNQP